MKQAGRFAAVTGILICILLTVTSCEKKGLKPYTVDFYKDVTYKTFGTEELKLDIYLPTQRKSVRNPVAFYFHSGAWVMGDKEEVTQYMQPALDALRENGIAVFSVNYRYVSSEIKYPLPVIDCIDAVSWAVMNAEKYDLDTQKMGSWGMSAGGYLSLMTGFASSHFSNLSAYKKYPYTFKFTVDLCGPAVFDKVSFADLSDQAKAVVANFIGSSFDKNWNDFVEAAPAQYVNLNKPKLLIIHGNQDEFVPFGQSQELFDLAKKAQVPAELVKVENASHSFQSVYGKTIYPSMESLYQKIADFITKAVAS